MNPDEPRARLTMEFSSRLIEGFFRRTLAYLFPVVLFAALGVYTASSSTAQFVSSGTLNASANPLVNQTEVRGGDIGIYESPGSGTARLINEQLQTDSFVDDVAERAGLLPALEAGLITRGVVREQVYASTKGENFLGVNAVWSDGDTAYQLVQATIDGYLAYVDDVVNGDSLAAIEFWTDREQIALESVTDSEDNLNAYLETSPSARTGQDPSVEESLTVARLNNTLDRALADVQVARDGILTAERAADGIRSEAGRQLRVVDQPAVPLVRESQLVRQFLTVMMFTVLGILVGLAALILATLADRSVRSREQLSRILGSEIAVTMPVVKSLKSKRRPRPNDQPKAA